MLAAFPADHALERGVTGRAPTNAILFVFFIPSRPRVAICNVQRDVAAASDAAAALRILAASQMFALPHSPSLALALTSDPCLP